MDISALAKEVTAFLAPFVPYLLKAGEKATEEAGRKLGSEAWERARALWSKLRLKVEARPSARKAVADLAAEPQNEDAQATLRLQLRKLLAEEEELAREIAHQWAAARAAGVTAIASGDRSVAIGGNVSDSTIITGDGSTVQRGKYNIQIDKASNMAIGDGSTVNPPDEEE